METLIAAVVYQENAAEAALALWAAVDNLRAQGKRVGGLLNARNHEAHYIDHTLTALVGGESFRILNNLNANSVACRLNPAAQAQAAMALAAELAEGVDVLFINKFGVAESEGGGFFDQFAEAASAGVPVVSMVENKYLPAWQEFVGELGEKVKISDLPDWLQARV